LHGNYEFYNCRSCGLSGIREAEINVAEGKKQARILSSEAYKLEQINQARGICFALSFS